jgi:hypothetical protein
VAEQGPLETTKLIGVPLFTWVPATGLWEAMLPVATVCEHADVWVPTVRLSPLMVLPALVWENPTTLGTPMVELLFETVSLTTVVDLTDAPAAGS